MRPLTTAELLMVWERGLNQSPLERTLTLLAAACPESDAEGIGTWPIGRRDAHLMQLREWLFGPRLASTATCPGCAERVEWESRVADFLPPGAEEGAGDADFDLSASGYTLRFRLPTSQDLAAVLDAPGGAARQDLLSRCILSARQGDRTCAVPELPPAVLTELARRMDALDPRADIRMALTCPQCGHGWRVPFDIAGYLWAEIEQWARQTLDTVHRLARAYGWSERDILELSPVRRQLYLTRVDS